jgi:hypothetical protein
VDDARKEKLSRLLERLGHVIHEAVEDSEEVRSCLNELRSDGWDAVMFLEAAMLCRPDEGAPTPDGVRIHVASTRPSAEYRLDAVDARWLASIGISPTRHRSHPGRALPPLSTGRTGIQGDD